MQLTRLALIPIVLLLAPIVQATAQDTDKTNSTLLAATSLFEDMVDFALARNDAGIKPMFQTLGAAISLQLVDN